MIPSAWFPLRPHIVQDALWRCDARFVGVLAGRGSGKTEISRRRVVRFLPLKKPWKRPLYFYAVPTYKMAKRIAWPEIKDLIPRHWIADINESELKITTVFGSVLYLFGMDKPERAEGSQYDGGVIDESSDQKPDVFKGTFLPALSHRNGWCWRIGVPKRHGQGAADFKEFCDMGLENQSLMPGNPQLRVQTFHWKSEDIVKPDIIAFARATLDPREFSERYCANWETASGAIYYGFDDDLNVSPVAVYNRELPIVVASDFNVSPMSWCLCHQIGDKVHVFDHIWRRDTNTQETLNYLFSQYGGHTAGWEFFGDATGRARKTAASSAAQSDYLLIRGDERFYGAQVFYPSVNPSISDRYTSVNSMLCTVDGRRRILINPKCIQLRKGLGSDAYKDGTRIIDTRNKDAGHAGDSLGYYIHRRFPLRASINKTPQKIFMGSARERVA